MPAARQPLPCSHKYRQDWYQASLVAHGDQREWAGVALRSLAAEHTADGGGENTGVSWGSSLMGLAQPRERVSPGASSHPSKASCTAGMDDNPARSGLGGLHSCMAV